MAPLNKKIKTYGRSNKSLVNNSLDAGKKMFPGKIAKHSRKRKLLIKELPARTNAETFLGQDSFQASIDDTFDKLVKGTGYNRVNIKSQIAISHNSDHDASKSIKTVNKFYSPILTRRRKKDGSILEVTDLSSPYMTRSKSKSFRNTSNSNTTKNKCNSVFLRSFKETSHFDSPISMKRKKGSASVSEACSTSVDFVNRSEAASKSKISSLFFRFKEPTVDKIDCSLEVEKVQNPVAKSLSYIIIPERRDEKNFQNNSNMTKPDTSFETFFSQTFRERQNIHSSTPLVLNQPKKIVNYTISPIKNISETENQRDKESIFTISKDSSTPLKCNYSANVQYMSEKSDLKCEISNTSSNLTSSVSNWPQFERSETSKNEVAQFQQFNENKENTGSTSSSRFPELRVNIPRQSFITLRRRKIFKVNNFEQKGSKKKLSEVKNVAANTIGNACTEHSSVHIKKALTIKGDNASLPNNLITYRRLTDSDAILHKQPKKAFRRLSLQDNDSGSKDNIKKIFLNQTINGPGQKEAEDRQNKNNAEQLHILGKHKSLDVATKSFQHDIHDKYLSKELIVNVTKHNFVLPQSSSTCIIDLTDSFDRNLIKKSKDVSDIFTLREEESYHQSTAADSSQIEEGSFKLPVISGMCSYQSEVFYGFDLRNGVLLYMYRVTNKEWMLPYLRNYQSYNFWKKNLIEDLTNPVNNSQEKTDGTRITKRPRSVTFSNSESSDLDNISHQNGSLDKFVNKELKVNITQSPWRIKNIKSKGDNQISIIDLTDSLFEKEIIKSKNGDNFELRKIEPYEICDNSDIIESSMDNGDITLKISKNIWKPSLKTSDACREVNDSNEDNNDSLLDEKTTDSKSIEKTNNETSDVEIISFPQSPTENKCINKSLILNITRSSWQTKNKHNISSKGSMENSKLDLSDSVDKRDWKKSEALVAMKKSRSHEKQEMSDIIESSLLPDQFEDDHFKMPVLPSKSLVLKAGKSWRRSLSLYKRSSMMLTAINKNIHWLPDGNSYVHSPYDWARQTLSSRRNSIRIVPARPTNDCQEKSVLENYAHIASYVSDRIFEDNLENDLRSLSLSKRKSSIVENSVPVAARELVLKRCGQEEPLPFEECYPKSALQNCQKIGEGVYGEVFLFRNPNGGTSVMKIIPIEGDLIVNGERQKKFEEILSEITIALELSNLRNKKQNKSSGFSEVQKVCCVQGRYPEKLIDLWDLFNETRGSDNDSPEIFGDDQLYIVLQLANGGKDMEAFVFNNALQAYTMFQQVACALAVAEDELCFEHRDLHWGNILLSVVDRNEKVTFWLDGKNYDIMTKGVEVAIIDFTLSRIEIDGVVIFNDLSLDPELFTAEGDYQFEIYKLMQKKNGNNWQRFEPYSNILWLHYTLDKAITALHYKNKQSKVHKEYLGKLKQLKDEILNYNSVKEFVTENF